MARRTWYVSVTTSGSPARNTDRSRPSGPESRTRVMQTAPSPHRRPPAGSASAGCASASIGSAPADRASPLGSPPPFATGDESAGTGDDDVDPSSAALVAGGSAPPSITDDPRSAPDA